MLSRRQTIRGLALAPFAAAALPATAAPAWKPYAQFMAIDGAGGSLLGFIEPDDPAVPGELAAIRASGLTAIILTVAPQGRFWLDDDADRFDTLAAILSARRHSDACIAKILGGNFARVMAEVRGG